MAAVFCESLGTRSQDVLTALGKILVNREKWSAWFQEHDGLVILKMDGVIYRRSDELYSMVERHLVGTAPAQRIRDRKPAGPSKRPARTNPQQNPMFNLDPEDDDSLDTLV